MAAWVTPAPATLGSEIKGQTGMRQEVLNSINHRSSQIRLPGRCNVPQVTFEVGIKSCAHTNKNHTQNSI